MSQRWGRARLHIIENLLKLIIFSPSDWLRRITLRASGNNRSSLPTCLLTELGARVNASLFNRHERVVTMQIKNCRCSITIVERTTRLQLSRARNLAGYCRVTAIRCANYNTVRKSLALRPSFRSCGHAVLEN